MIVGLTCFLMLVCRTRGSTQKVYEVNVVVARKITPGRQQQPQSAEGQTTQRVSNEYVDREIAIVQAIWDLYQVAHDAATDTVKVGDLRDKVLAGCEFMAIEGTLWNPELLVTNQLFLSTTQLTYREEVMADDS